MNYSIGQMAKIFNISSQTLRYYESIGLFIPLAREENNYRLYSPAQFHELRTILFLKNIGLPLLDIKKYKDIKDLKALYQILQNRSLKIKSEIQRLKDLNESIEDTLNDIDNSYRDYNYEYPNIKYFDSRFAYMIHGKFNHDKISNKIEDLIEDIFMDMEKDHNLNVNKLGTIIDRKDLLDENFSSYSGIFMLQDKSKNQKIVEFPAGTYACIYHKGAYSSIGKSYKKLLSFIKSKNKKIKNFSIELALIDIKLSTDPNNYITDIQILIED